MRMRSGAGVYQTGNPTVLRNYVASCMPDGWADTHTARVDEIRASETAAYRALTQIYAAANTLTSSDVREKLVRPDFFSCILSLVLRLRYRLHATDPWT